MLKLYNYAPSGNCYKVRLLLAQLGIPYDPIDLDMKKGETRTPEFRARFPLGRIPVLELDTGEQLAESNAILCYFGEGTEYVPQTKLARGQMMQWLFWEQYVHEPTVAVVRAWLAYFGIPRGREADVPTLIHRGYQALDVMEHHFGKAAWFSGDRYGLADIALYAYTHVAHEGSFDLSRYAQLPRWLDRVRAQPGHVEI